MDRTVVAATVKEMIRIRRMPGVYDRSVPRWVRHSGALVMFAGLTMLWLFAVLREPLMVVPGSEAGDNLTFVWNTWWMRRALSSLLWPFWTSWLFAPWGVDLTLHSHTALPSAVAGLLSRGGSIVAATNAVIALHLFLNCTAAYALSLRMTRHVGAAILAAFVFGCSPYIGAHLPGHFNLIAAWVLPLTVVLLLQSLEDASRTASVLLGLSLGATAYVDYYYLVYATVLVTLILVGRSVTVTRGRRDCSRWQSVSLRVLTFLLLMDLAVIISIAATGGGVLRIGGISISVFSVENPISVAVLLASAALAVRLLTALRFAVDWSTLSTDVRRMGTPAAMGFVLAAPLLLAASRLWLHGGYTTQRYLWRSAPAGIDVGTMVLGNPTGLAWSVVPGHLYARLGINQVEQTAWLGPGVLCLCAAAALSSQRADVRRWAAIASIFLIWALGPYLVAFGHRLPILLPATMVRYLPIVANARIPGRAMVVVYLALSALSSIGLAALLGRGHRALAVALVAIVVVDYAPAPAPVFRLDRPAVYDVLRAQRGEGAVCELPMGLRDGFGERGRFDSRVMFYQTIHERPMTGGFVARLPPQIAEAYLPDPVLGTLLRLSGGDPLNAERPPQAADAGALLLAHRIRFVVVNRRTSPPDLLTYVRIGLPLRLLAEDESRSLYEIYAPVSPPFVTK
jgi:hypothetical protein